MGQPSMIEVPIPDESKFTVCGDIHGQFYDLMNIFKLNGLPSTENPYVSFFSKQKILQEFQHQSYWGLAIEDSMTHSRPNSRFCFRNFPAQNIFP